MENLQTTLDMVLRLLIQFGLAVAALLTGVELWLRGALQQAGVPHTFQTPILLLVAALLIVGALRLFGGLIRVAAVLILVLIAIDIVMPVVQG